MKVADVFCGFFDVFAKLGVGFGGGYRVSFGLHRGVAILPSDEIYIINQSKDGISIGCHLFAEGVFGCGLVLHEVDGPSVRLLAGLKLGSKTAEGFFDTESEGQ